MNPSLLDGEILPIASFLMLLFALAAAELWRPLHASRPEPGGRIPTNIFMGLINAGLSMLIPVSTVISADWAYRHHFGLLNQAHVPLAVLAMVTVAIRSLGTYFIHRLSRRIPLLWNIHRIHHSDIAIDLSTGFRNHPLELLYVAPLLAGIVIALGLDASTLLIYEAVAVGFALWDHANLHLPPRLDRFARLLLVTPAMHHVHHSALRAETDSNYGDVISLWDRLFGTYRALDQDAVRAMRIGLGDAEDVGSASLLRQLRAPIAGLVTKGRSEA